ncbi:prenyltransferase/squalene oxidase-like repeat protein [Kitasatospora sp. SolWspMP-SS2h]|uniref:prenyltransferase/squalene oxidase repeat-containing protein n=1 Tax=Kitasatospora sp. SolWspMP-SS2h TaxID=1305729 RepID=UPI000DB962AA|nr:prenyltransferase/squalene oxidase repeat-containing protein [Kitasatospora sp. SolWspMP-SS2h]RAJ45363.1 prenyltransferase/squalene oxidase-like repeat protein [Kitasatospora sp. SolWspMP-SS2h]
MRVTNTLARHGRGDRRLTPPALAAALAVTAGATLVLGHPGRAAADPIEDCTATTGAIVAVDFGHWGGGVVRGCDAHPTTGMNLLHNAGFTTTGTQHDGPAFICRLGSSTFGNGAQYPTPAEEPCVNTPQATAYWSYWIAAPGQDTWSYSQFGADGQKPKPGEVEAWVYGGTDIGGTSGGPAFTPDSVRAKNSASPSPAASESASASPSASASASASPSGASSPSPTGPPPATGDPAAAAAWLAGQLVDGSYLGNWAFEGPDYPRTALTAVALAAAGTQDPALRKVVAFLQAHTDDFLLPDGPNGAPDTRAAALLALVAESTGGDPRAFGGHDLIAALTDHVCTAAGENGQCTAAGDFRGAASPWTQSLAVLALLRANATVPPAALDRFTVLQCADGGISGAMIGAGEYCESDPSTTALAVLALHAAGGHEPAVERATAQLAASQQPDGSYLPYAGASGGDTSSTAGAAQGLRAAGRPTGQAATWLAARQNPDGGFATDAWTPDSDPAATEQAILALTGTDPLTVTHDLGPTAPGTPQPGRTPDLAKGGAYLTDPARLLDGHYYEAFPDSGFADFGLTIDAAYALAATGTDDAALRRIVDFLDRQGTDGSGRTVNDWTAVGTEYVGGGSVGKEALLAEIVGRDPHAFGGHDLIAALDQAVCDHADADNGCAAQGNYLWATSVFSQSLGVMAQLRAGDAEHAAAPLAYLKGLQAANGSWPSLIPASGDSDVDSTAMAVMALALVPGDEAARAVDKGLAWLAAQQLPDGGFPGAAGDSTNSAALAVQGLTLRRSAHAERIAKAVEFLAAEQNADGGFNVASTGQQGSDVRASTQAIGGATGLSFGTLHRDLGGTAPTGSPSPSVSQSASPSPSPSVSQSVSPSPSSSGSDSASPSPSSPASPSSDGPSGSAPAPSPSTGTGAGTGAGAGGLPGGPGAPAGGAGTDGTGPDGLAFTGTDVLELVVPGLLFAAAGGAVLVATRRRNAPGAGRHR